MTNATSVASPQGKPTPPTEVLKELTVRGVILGVLITLIFTAANVFFGLKAGLTFSDLDPRGRHLHGGAARIQGRDDPGKQHRSDRRVGGRNAVVDHLRACPAW